jgi:hypothetical protein
MPCPRSGHSSDVHNGKMYVFGGILELTKELNECICYDFATCKFELVCGGEMASEEMQLTGNLREGGESPSAITKQGTLQSPGKLGRRGTISPSKLGKSPLKLRKKSPSKKGGDTAAGEKKDSGLISPTSISM